MLSLEYYWSCRFLFYYAYGAILEIGTLPILVLWEMKLKNQKYLPKLAKVEWAGMFIVDEPDAGSDANSGKTKQLCKPDGKTYMLKVGQKMWNAGFADLFIVFAKIEDDKEFWPHLSWGNLRWNYDEWGRKKRGSRGSSTRQYSLTIVQYQFWE